MNRDRYLIEPRQVGYRGELTRWVILDTATPREGEGSKRFPHTVVSIHRTEDDAITARRLLTKFTLDR